MATVTSERFDVPADGIGNPRDRSLPDDLKDVADDARSYLTAEIAFQKSRVAFAGGEAKAIAVFVLAALVFIVLAVFAAVFGLILALTPWLTAWGATALVCGVLLALALLFVWRALARWRGLVRAVADPGTS